MAYMRNPYYAYRSGTTMYIQSAEADEGIALPLEVFDALVVMRYAQLQMAEGPVADLLKLEREVADRYDGNFGADALRRKLGLKTGMDRVLEQAKVK